MRSNERKKEEHQACLTVTDFLSENAAKPHSEMKRSGIERVVSNFNFIFLVAMRLGETPVHIPNTMVKT